MGFKFCVSLLSIFLTKKSTRCFTIPNYSANFTPRAKYNNFAKIVVLCQVRAFQIADLSVQASASRWSDRGLVEKSHYIYQSNYYDFGCRACAYTRSFARSCSRELKPLIKSYRHAGRNVNPDEFNS